MGKITGFLEYKRETPRPRPVEERVKDYEEIYPLMPERALQTQAARCMIAGFPFVRAGVARCR
ncbi:MAG: glutamate synthase, partial [Planctomycetota bacterium]